MLGCQSSMKITDFAGLSDLPKNPVRIVLGINFLTFNEETVFIPRTNRIRGAKGKNPGSRRQAFFR